MEAKEKALQLCQKFGYLGIKWEQTNHYTLKLENAKQCALICVDELIQQCHDYRDIDLGASKDYWQEVKKEIDLL
jgi:hypothetical protein